VAHRRGGAHTEEQHWSKWLTAEEVLTQKNSAGLSAYSRGGAHTEEQHWSKWLIAEERQSEE
jgi:hypothetical protein